MISVEPVDALLVIDVGNTRVGLAVWDADGLHEARRVRVDQPEAWEAALSETWAHIRSQKQAVVIGSVNPPATVSVQKIAERVSGLSALRVRDDLPLPIALDIDNEYEVGVDRICSAAAAYERIGGACAVASFGTAVTVDCVSEDGVFLGGAILPGFELCCDALHAHTAQLPRVDMRVPQNAFGKNTHDAIINGVGYGLMGALREIVERFATDLRVWPHLVITGGNAPEIAEMADFVDAVVPDLCLMGVALAHRKAAGMP
jgi:type III pantothenate kinase